MKNYTLSELREKALTFQSNPDDMLKNLIGNNAIRKFLISLDDEEIQELKKDILSQ